MLSRFIFFITQRYRIYQWKKQYNIKQKQHFFNTLYASTDGFSLSQKDRLKNNDIALSYGEIDFIPFSLLLHNTSPSSEDVFYDLGSGVGKAVIAASLLTRFKACYGIECLDSLHHTACQIATQTKPFHNVHFIHANFLDEDISRATIIFINATAYFGDLWQAIVDKFCNLNDDVRLIVSSKTLPESHFVLQFEGLANMSWGACSVRIYRKKKKLAPFNNRE